jgi:hypothetical protein
MLNFKVKNSCDTLRGYYDRVLHMPIYKGHKLSENKPHCNKHLNFRELSDNYKHNKKLQTVIHKLYLSVSCAVSLKRVGQYAKLAPSSPVSISYDIHNEFKLVP